MAQNRKFLSKMNERYLGKFVFFVGMACLELVGASIDRKIEYYIKIKKKKKKKLILKKRLVHL
jgi:hypothetical protein